jgi:uncharacterized protein YdeI (YjbR/CyaY-like superfamily)
VDAQFFETPEALRAWLEEHHTTASELWVGFYKKGSGRPSITWPESVDEALCFGWIDGIRKSIDAESYRIRFTPRKPRSIWSAVNIARVAELTAQGRMRPAGLATAAKRHEDRSWIYSHEQGGEVALDEAAEALFRANAPAWAFFQAQAPHYRRAAAHWVAGAKQEQTRARRLAALIEDSAVGLWVRPLRRREGQGGPRSP